MDCASLLMEMAVRNLYAYRINFFDLVVTSHLVTSPMACAVTLVRMTLACGRFYNSAKHNIKSIFPFITVRNSN